MDRTEDFEDGELSPAERQRLRRLLTLVTFADEEPGGDGGDVVLSPGLGGEGEDARPGRIVMENPGGAAVPLLTIRGMEGGDVDVYVGSDPPREDMAHDVRVGSVYLELGGGPGGGRPVKVHRRSADGWVWPRWS